jgi:hypothetical protein
MAKARTTNDRALLRNSMRDFATTTRSFIRTLRMARISARPPPSQLPIPKERKPLRAVRHRRRSCWQSRRDFARGTFAIPFQIARHGSHAPNKVHGRLMRY